MPVLNLQVRAHPRVLLDKTLTLVRFGQDSFLVHEQRECGIHGDQSLVDEKIGLYLRSINMPEPVPCSI